jgi:TetR/AcrR family transcriptional regulator, tetracycline repressor protein
MRRQRPRGTTRPEAVVDAALKVVDEVGVDGLTIRAVAGLVGAPPMSLYTHFVNKEGLLDLMNAEISRRLYRDFGQRSWEAELSALSLHVRRTLLEHPHWAPLLTRPTAPTSSPVRERVLSLMISCGIPPELGLEFLTSALLTTFALTFVELRFRESDGGSNRLEGFDSVKTGVIEAEGEPEPPPTRVAFAGTYFDLESTFRRSLSALIEGLAASHQTNR